MNENNIGGSPAPQVGGQAPTPQNPMPAANLHGGHTVMSQNNVAPAGGVNQPMMPTVDPAAQMGVNPNPKLGLKSDNKKSIIDIIILVAVSLVAVAGIICSVLFYMQWDEAQADIDGKISAAEAAARAEQQDIDEKNFAEREKQPNLQFTGPADYGSLSFMYPRTWSVYVGKDANNGGDFEAYLHPSQVSPVSAKTINALRVTIYDRPIEQVRKTYDALVKSGKLTMNVFQVGDITGDRYDGAFSNDITGSMVMIKINDKTAILRTDAEQFRTDFETLIATIRLN